MILENIIYGLYCPDKKTPVYVGKSRKGFDRPWTHISIKSHSKKVNTWMETLSSVGKQPVIVVLDSADSEDVLNAKEKFWIQWFVSKGNMLLNVQGVTPSYFLDKIIDESDFMSNVRMYVIHQRKRCKLTQVELSDKSGVGLTFIRDLEQGRKSNFSTEKLNLLLRMFGGKLSVE